MSESGLQDQLKQLCALQKIDAQIFECRRLNAEKPEQLQALSAQFEGKKEGLKQLEESKKRLQLDRKNQEGELQVKDEAIAKANVQLSQIKNNKEYTAKISEIESIKADRSLIEERIILAYDEADKIQEEVEREKATVSEEEKRYLDSKQAVEKEIKELEVQIGNLQAQRKDILPQLDKNLLQRYDRILENKEGLAMVPVDRAACGGCYMNVPPQVINDIKKYEDIVCCEVCSRILYLREDMSN